jgi:hypothetical protein
MHSSAGTQEDDSKLHNAWSRRVFSGRTNALKHTYTIQKNPQRLSFQYLDDDESGFLEKSY